MLQTRFSMRKKSGEKSTANRIGFLFSACTCDPTKIELSKANVDRRWQSPTKRNAKFWLHRIFSLSFCAECFWTSYKLSTDQNDRIHMRNEQKTGDATRKKEVQPKDKKQTKTKLMATWIQMSPTHTKNGDRKRNQMATEKPRKKALQQM